MKYYNRIVLGFRLGCPGLIYRQTATLLRLFLSGIVFVLHLRVSYLYTEVCKLAVLRDCLCRSSVE
jgi:hypothetical protein